ncbi:MAG: DNA polymerase ligase N-terminal domain-containing protein [Candidatus Nanoarchaeia archaeon]|jgi:hypothetical protein|nr:DNA polymerase ligase N-terminal domain-containing protein [Candidatus Nanoarchaeia archaeon]
MSYNKEKIKIGYIGDFVIHDHDASHHHWDLRLEFPVNSLKNSLTEFYKKRVWNKTTEQEPVFPDKPGVVLRSWAIPKHKLPKSKPLLATETEEHDISYKDFKGIIPKDNYGAGTVDIYDKGKFEIVDFVYDKKYVIKFNGKKIKGYYALIKTNPKTFLWTKVKDISEYKKSNSNKIIEEIVQNPLRERRDYGKKNASIIDFPQSSLCPQIWNVNSFPPQIKQEIREKILSDLFKVFLNNFKEYKKWVTNVSISGSITTNLYNFKTDIDVNVSIDYDLFRKYNLDVSRHCLDDLELRTFIRKKVYILNGKKLARDHPIKYFVIGKGKQLESDFVYDLLNKKWVVQPILVDSLFNPDIEFSDAKSLALNIISKIILEIMFIRTNIIDLLRLQSAGKDTSKIEIFIKKSIEHLKFLKNKIKEIRLIRFKTKNIKLLSYSFSKNWEFFNIVYKYIDKYGFKDPLEFLYKMLTVEEKNVLDIKRLKVSTIKRCPKKDLTKDRPKSKQNWCLYDSKGEKLLGRHPSKEKALSQERAIQIHKKL